jgi:hypothetical protein
MSEFYTGMRGPDAVSKLNQLWGLVGSVSGSEAAAASALASANTAVAAANTASSSATAAANNAAAVASQVLAAYAAYDNFDDRYLGEKSTGPALDNDGNPILVGALYFNVVDNNMYVRSGTDAWVSVSSLASSTAAANSATAAGT